MLTQVEGIASDIIKDTDTLKLGGNKPKLGKTKTVVMGITKKNDGLLLTNAIQETLITFVDEPLHKTRDFESEYSRIKKFTGLSRHSILHGIQTKYNNYTNSLRLFLIIDIIFYIGDNFNEVIK